MQPITRICGPAISLLEADINTDDIIPKQFMKGVTRQGLKSGLFYNRRVAHDGEPLPSSVFDRPPYAQAKVLVAGSNFGCGSSREHAVWALKDFGIDCIIAPSFADIFYANALKRGLLLVTAADQFMCGYAKAYQHGCPYMAVDLVAQSIHCDALPITHFSLDPQIKSRLLRGEDEIAETLGLLEQIQAYERQHQG